MTLRYTRITVRPEPASDISEVVKDSIDLAKSKRCTVEFCFNSQHFSIDSESSGPMAVDEYMRRTQTPITGKE